MLTPENYFSPEMMLQYMSASQFHAFETCQFAALAQLRGEYVVEKDVFKEGHYFEAALSGDEDLFLAQNPDMVSSKGPTKGDLKSNYKRVVGSASRFIDEPMFMDIYNRCEKQVILSGIIAGVPFKGMVDLLDMETFDVYDTKCVKDFKKVWSDADHSHVNWYFAYGYHYQMAIYRELVLQTYGKAGHMRLMAVTKEEIPDIGGFEFTDEVLNGALDIIREFTPKYDIIKRGGLVPEACGHCDWCKPNKDITEFETVGEYE